jgi:hypothetical protein
LVRYATNIAHIGQIDPSEKTNARPRPQFN